MAKNKNSPRQLIVEGYDDLSCVAGLMRAHIAWRDDDPPVYINLAEGVEPILGEGYLTAKLKMSGLRSLGVMLDADDNPAGRYQRIRDICRELFPELPELLPPSGVVVANGEGLRFGVWIMPDNMSDGIIETFLRYLVPEQAEPLWTHAVDSTAIAAQVGATYKAPQIPKANLYNWLAWQDPPGQYPGIALRKAVLDPTAPHARLFVDWFRNLYQL